MWPKAFWVLGTDTDVGKTVTAATLTLGLHAKYWKPVQAGIHDGTDTQRVAQMTGLPKTHFAQETYCLSEPLSPHAAAAIDEVEIDLNAFQIPRQEPFAHLVIEGAGGLMVPLNQTTLLIDLVQRTGLPCVLVCRSTLGTLNHTLLSLKALRDYGIPVLGLILNGPPNESNHKALLHYGEVGIIGSLYPLDAIDPQNLRHVFASWQNP